MSEPRIDLKLRELVFGHTKICGLSNSVDADLAYIAGASLGGMILADGSKRTVSINQAERISKNTKLPMVAVFKDQSCDYVCKVANKADLYAVQLHGQEDDTYLRKLRTELPVSVEIWKTLHVTDHLPKPPSVKVDALLLENGNHKLAGGSGEAFNWSLLKDVASAYKDYSPFQIILAGGINIDNLDKIKNTPILRIDLASGVESKPGIKDHIKIKQFFTTLRQQVFNHEQ